MGRAPYPEKTMTDYSYGWEKLHLAVLELASSTENQRDRLETAVAFNLLQIEPERDLPEEAREQFQELLAALTEHSGPGDHVAIKHTVGLMDDSAVDKAVEDIIGLYDSICRHRTPFAH